MVLLWFISLGAHIGQASAGDMFYQVFNNIGDVKSLDDVDMDASNPGTAGRGLSVSPAVTSATDYFAIRYSFDFLAPGGEVMFFLNSDDGSRLYVDGEVVIFNDGLHGARTLSTKLNLSSGWHAIRLDYFEKTGSAILDLQYQTDGMAVPLPMGGSVVRPGADRDEDFYNDSYDQLFASGCNLNNLANVNITDFRNCDFNDKTFPAGTYRDKYFDGSTFYSANLSNVTFIDSSFKNVDFRGQYNQNNGGGVSTNGFVKFINADFTSATVEKHWTYARFYNVNFSNTFFDTDDSDNYDPGWYCYEGSRFLNSDLIRYGIPGVPGGEQNYRLGVPGSTNWHWDLSSFWDHPCVRDIPRDSQSIVAELNNTSIDIAPAIFLKEALTQPYDSFAVIDQHDYPISGNDTLPAYRSASSTDSLHWEWDMGRYYRLDSIRIHKNPERPNELDDAFVIISEWPIGNSPLLQVDFDSTVRYQLNATAKPYYEIPLNHSLRYIHIQRPADGTNKNLSFKKIEMFGNSTPLAGVSTPEPANFVLPLFESNRPECEGMMFNEANIDPNFDKLAAIVSGVWDNGDLSREIRNEAEFSYGSFQNTNFEQTELVGADFSNAQANGANFRGANLAGADFRGAQIRGADFRGANLAGANFGDVYPDCAYFSGELPASYYSGVQSHENPEFPMISALSGNSAYGYARASSLDLGTYPSLAIDNNPATSSVTAVEKTPWWELDMGAIYVLKNVALDTDHDLATVEQLELFVSDWPLPFGFDGTEVAGQVYQIADFVVDPNDSSKIKFNTAQTGRFIHVRAAKTLGELRLRLAEVTAETPLIASAPSSDMPLTDNQASNLVPNTQNLLNQIDSLIAHYEKVDPSDGIESARESLSSLLSVASETIGQSQGLIEIQKNFRVITRPIDSSVFLIKRLGVIPALKPRVDNFVSTIKPVQNVFKGLNLSTHAIQQNINVLNHFSRGTIKATSSALSEVNSQVSILNAGRSYIQTIQRCALYGTNSDQVRSALEAESLQIVNNINGIIGKIGTDKEVLNSVINRRQDLQDLSDIYSNGDIEVVRQTSSDVVEFMGPFASAITPMQLLFSGGEIYDGLTIWDIIDFVTGLSDFFLNLPGVKDVIAFVDGLFSPVLDPIFSVLTDVVDEVILGPFGESLDSAKVSLDFIGTGLSDLAASITKDAEYVVPNVSTDIFSNVVNISGDSIFASCRDSLNLPPQWPVADNDDDGDGLANAFEIGYAPDNIPAVTNTLSDSPDSDLDGLSDYFEWYWTTQAGANDLPFIPNNGSLGEAERDDDNDGLTALQEEVNGTNPYVADTDGDGIKDGDEVLWKLNPLSVQGDLSDLERDLDDDGVTIAQELAYQLDPIDPLDIYEDPDADGVSTDQEILQATSPLITSPLQLQQSVIVLTDPVELNNEIAIDLSSWLVYGGSDAMVIIPAASTIEEGNLIIDDPNSLNVRIQLDATNSLPRQTYALIKVESDGGNLLVRVLIDMQFDTRVEQSINFAALVDKVYGDTDFGIAASASSGLSVSFDSSTPAVCTSSNSLVSIISTGTCSIVASQAGDANYFPAVDVVQSFAVALADQTIDFMVLNDRTILEERFVIPATASSGLMVDFISLTPPTCEIRESDVVFLAVGNCQIQASQSGDNNYSPAMSVVQSFNITKVDQTISFANLVDRAYGDAAFDLSAIATSNLAVSFTSTSPNVCRVNGVSVNLNAPGTCSITASQTGDGTYNPAVEVVRSFNVAKAEQVINFVGLADKVYGDASFNLDAVATSELTVLFVSTTVNVCSVTGNAVSILSAGSCSIIASQTGDQYYNPAVDVIQSFNVAKAEQTIDFTALVDKIYGDANFNLDAVATSELTVSFVSTTVDVCSVTGNAVSILSAGSCSITASQTGDQNYNSAVDVIQSFNVAKAEQTIGFLALRDKVYGDANFNLDAAASSELTVSFVSTTVDVCSVTGNSVSILSTGSCSITASQTGDQNYNPAVEVIQSFNVAKAEQTISFTPIPEATIGDLAIDLLATSSSELTVLFNSETSTVCSVNNNQVVLLEIGVCTITASQQGDNNFNPAIAVTQNFNIRDSDNDGDGIGDNEDPDDDNDGYSDQDEVDNGTDPLDSTSIPEDNDGDFISNLNDEDDDNDGVLDVDDEFPFDETESQDSDGDGIGDNADPTPYPPAGELNFDSTDYLVLENSNSVMVTVNRINGDYGELSVDYALQDGSATASNDYEFHTGTLTFIDGQTSQTIIINILDDVVYEGDESFNIELSNLVGDGMIGANSSATIVIQENEAVPPAGEISFEFNTEILNENDGELTVNVIRSGGDFGELRVSYNSVDGSAIASSDYTAVSGQLIFADGEVTKAVIISLVNDDVYEVEESFSIHLSNLIGDGTLGRDLVAVTILDDEPTPPAGVLEIENATYSIDEDGISVAINIIRANGQFGEVSVDISSINNSALAGEDYELFAQTITFSDAEIVKTVTVSIIDDETYEGDENFNLSLSNPVGTMLGNQTTSIIHILENDAVPPAGVIQFSGELYTVNENSGTVLLTITRTNGSYGEVSLDVTTVDGTAIADQDYQSSNSTIIFEDGETSKTISLTIFNNENYQGDRRFNLTLFNLVGDAMLGDPSSASIVIAEDESVPATGVVQLSGYAYLVDEGDESIMLTLMRTGGSYGDVGVDYQIVDGSAINGSDYLASNGVVYFNDGEVSQTIVIDIVDDELDEENEVFSIVLSSSVGGLLGEIKSAMITIEDNDEAEEESDDGMDDDSSDSGSLGILWLLLAYGLIRIRKKYS